MVKSNTKSKLISKLINVYVWILFSFSNRNTNLYSCACVPKIGHKRSSEHWLWYWMKQLKHSFNLLGILWHLSIKIFYFRMKATIDLAASQFDSFFCSSFICRFIFCKQPQPTDCNEWLEIWHFREKLPVTS